MNAELYQPLKSFVITALYRITQKRNQFLCFNYQYIPVIFRIHREAFFLQKKKMKDAFLLHVKVFFLSFRVN